MRAFPSRAEAFERETVRHPIAKPLTFDEAYATSARSVWRARARLGVPEEHLADATQDVFLVVLRQLDRFEGRSSLNTWLFGIALRVASDYRRRLRKVAKTEPLPETLQDERGDDPFECAVRSEAVATLYRLLDELSEEQRAVFVFVELEELSVREAAEAVGANLHTVVSRLKTARQKFESALLRHYARSKGERP